MKQKTQTILKRSLVTGCAAVCISAPFLAQADEPKAAVDTRQDLDKVVVTATMTEKNIDDAPGSVQVINSKEIEEMGAQTVADALEQATGLFVERVEAGRVTSPNIRGTGTRHSLVLIDGRRMAWGYKNYMDIDQIPLEMVEKIEIIRGPASALYGSDAIGGVVNIITRKPPKKLTLNSTLQAGINGYGEGAELAGRGYIGDTIDRFGFIVGGGYRNKNKWDRDSIVPDDGDHEKLGSVSGRLGFKLNEQHSFLTGFEYSNKNREGLRYYQNRNRTRDADDTTHSYFAQYNGVFQPDLNLMLLANHAQHETKVGMSPFAPVTQEENATRKLDQIEARFSTLLFKKHLVTIGSEFRNENIKVPGVNKGVNNISGYIQDEYQIFNPLYLVAGLRFDEHSEFGSRWTPKASIVYSILEHLRLKGSFGTGFAAPGLSELYVTTMGKMGKEVYESNPNLKPEKSESYEFGVEGEYKIFSGKLTYFKNEIDDLIEAVYYKTVGSGANKQVYSKYQNVSKAVTEGIELESNLTIPFGFRIGGNFTWMDTKNKQTNKKLEGQPDYKGSLKLGYDNSDFGIHTNLRMDYIGERYFSTGQQSDYTLFNLYLSKTITKNLRLFAGINNIFDTKREKDGVVYIEPTYYYSGVNITF